MWRLAVVAAWALVGCGGVVERSSGGASEGEAGTASDPPGTTKPNDPPTGIDPNADTELGECVLGSTESRGGPCAWVTDSRCYATRAMACNCACPRDRDSQCLSGFENGPDGHVWVACN